MVNLDVVHTEVADLVKRQPLVAVFFGGTTGIGHYTLRALATAEAQYKGKGFRAYLVGRKPTRGEEIITECRQIYPEARITFLQVDDLSLLRDVDRACANIIQLEEEERDNPRVDFLMTSQGGPIFLPRRDTPEGLDKSMSLMYYSRMRAIFNLQPLLAQSPKPATVISVYAGGFEQKLFTDELSLRDLKRYSYSQARSHMVYMHTLFFEHLASQPEPAGKVSLVHIFPGLVLGPGFHDTEYPAWFRFIWRWMFIPVFGRLLTIEPAVSGMRMLGLASPRYPPMRSKNNEVVSSSRAGGEEADVVKATNGLVGGGCYALTWNGEDNFKAKNYAKFDKDVLRQQVVSHTLKAFDVIEAGGVFRE
ncbi:hypothetical protein BJY01DRAFT_223965 [Aspergillus pseudoustus]|uniref:NAD(P)-binding protein n=1 Tax=Aspergillus pseudoustus TaxID=1810923 RepID=A0ABR4J471_9EURO